MDQASTQTPPLARAPFVMAPEGVAALVEALRRRGYAVVGPTVRDGAIVYDEIQSAGELPAGWTDEQDGGTYRLKRRGDGALFGYAVGPQSWKRFLHPPVQRLWKVAQVGLVLHDRLFLHRRRERPLVDQGAVSTVDDAQAGRLDRPVRRLGLRGVRAVHHLVPGGHRHHRGSRGDPRFAIATSRP